MVEPPLCHDGKGKRGRKYLLLTVTIILFILTTVPKPIGLPSIGGEISQEKEQAGVGEDDEICVCIRLLCLLQLQGPIDLCADTIVGIPIFSIWGPHCSLWLSYEAEAVLQIPQKQTGYCPPLL